MPPFPWTEAVSTTYWSWGADCTSMPVEVERGTLKDMTLPAAAPQWPAVRNW